MGKKIQTNLIFAGQVGGTSNVASKILGLATKVYHSQTFLHSRFSQVILTQIPIETHVKMASKTVIRTINCRSVAAYRMLHLHLFITAKIIAHLITYPQFIYDSFHIPFHHIQIFTDKYTNI